MLKLETARILVISKNETDSRAIKTFLSRMPFNLTERDFAVGEVVPTDDYDFAIFDAMSLPAINKEMSKKEDIAHFQRFSEYLAKPIKYVVLYYGGFWPDLDRERCPSANSKFTLFARIRELIDFINHYRSE